MLFHTWPFLVFVLVVFPVFFALRKTSLWIPWLMLASYFFYGWWNPVYLLLLVPLTLANYAVAVAVAREHRHARRIRGGPAQGAGGFAEAGAGIDQPY